MVGLESARKHYVSETNTLLEIAHMIKHLTMPGVYQLTLIQLSSRSSCACQCCLFFQGMTLATIVVLLMATFDLCHAPLTLHIETLVCRSCAIVGNVHTP